MTAPVSSENDRSVWLKRFSRCCALLYAEICTSCRRVDRARKHILIELVVVAVARAIAQRQRVAERVLEQTVATLRSHASSLWSGSPKKVEGSVSTGRPAKDEMPRSAVRSSWKYSTQTRSIVFASLSRKVDGRIDAIALEGHAVAILSESSYIAGETKRDGRR